MGYDLPSLFKDKPAPFSYDPAAAFSGAAAAAASFGGWTFGIKN
jgi:energy-converting hydrogenase Eha subunit A